MNITREEQESSHRISQRPVASSKKSMGIPTKSVRKKNGTRDHCSRVACKEDSRVALANQIWTMSKMLTR
jgi:hypothetical protein